MTVKEKSIGTRPKKENHSLLAFIGYGHLGKFLIEKLRERPDEYEVVKVWNRTRDSENGVESLENIDAGALKSLDLVIEVAHPNIIETYGELILEHADLFIGSPTCLASQDLLDKLTKKSLALKRKVLVPAGAFWGANDIRKMADLGSLKGLTVTMTKHPSSFKLNSPLKEINEEAKKETEKATVLFEGTVRDLCPLAPNNVNTMAGAAIAASNLGFYGVVARLVSDPKMTDWHIVEVKVEGPDGFEVTTVRKNPAKPGAVTGQLTYYSFFSSIQESRYKPFGVHLC
ncbi:unnamed protein product [Caenorhabditis auriculariae]|uniref:Aspartate dehydrogenase domain-containing protein n=1 Tax=Caenorhabditis auriculariae TaxID=2777116 RepID=A0A8S1HI96_9PELO|nr:unnamed protein product [Caenorhabditis auriculariae]